MKSAILLLLTTLAPAFAVSPPAGHDADWNAGWTARDTYVAPATQPTTSPATKPTTQPTTRPTTRPTVHLAANADLGAVLSHATPGTLYIGATGAAYRVNGSPTITAADVSIYAQRVAVTPAKGATSGILVRGANFEWAVADCSSTDPTVNFIRAYAPRLNVHDCTYVHDVDDFILLDRSTPDTKDAKGNVAAIGMGADNATVTNCTGSKIGGYFVYSTCDKGTFTRLKAMDSTGQQNYRLDVNANGHIPSGNVYDTCEGNNYPHNGMDKETFSDRQGFGTLYLNCTVNGWAYCGQAAATSAGQFASVIYRGCKFAKLRPTGAQLQLGHGVTAIVDGCTFATDAAQSNIGTSPTVELTAANNVRAMTAPGVKPAKAFIANLGGTITESGTATK